MKDNTSTGNYCKHGNRMDRACPRCSDETDLVKVIAALRAENASLTHEEDNLRSDIRVKNETIAALRVEKNKLERTLTVMTEWLEDNQPDVFKRGIWDALSEHPVPQAPNAGNLEERCEATFKGERCTLINGHEGSHHGAKETVFTTFLYKPIMTLEDRVAYIEQECEAHGWWSKKPVPQASVTMVTQHDGLISTIVPVSTEKEQPPLEQHSQSVLDSWRECHDVLKPFLPKKKKSPRPSSTTK